MANSREETQKDTFSVEEKATSLGSGVLGHPVTADGVSEKRRINRNAQKYVSNEKMCKDACRVYTRSLIDQQTHYCKSGDLKLAEMGTVTHCRCLSDARGFINVIT